MILENASCMNKHHKGTNEQCDIKMQTRCDDCLMQYHTGMQGILYMFSFFIQIETCGDINLQAHYVLKSMAPAVR